MSDGGGDGCGCASVPYLLGSILAVVLSWDANRAVLWAIIHGILSWLYVIYYVVVNWSQARMI
jgi:branched-subunit amino acid transport protein